MVTTPTGEGGPSVTSHVVAATDNGHVPVPVLYLSTAGSTARTWETRGSMTCVTPGLVHVSIHIMLVISFVDFYYDLPTSVKCSFTDHYLEVSFVFNISVYVTESPDYTKRELA